MINCIKSFFTRTVYHSKKDSTMSTKNLLISYEDYVTSKGRYPDRLNSLELTPEVKTNISELLNKVNSLLEELGITSVDISSGFRTSESNAKVLNAAKKSLHMVGQAIDIIDAKDQKLSKKLQEDAEKNKENSLITKYGLWLEHPQHTIGKNTNWCHLDTSKSRKNRPVRVFTV